MHPPTRNPCSPVNGCTVGFPFHLVRDVQAPSGVAIENSRVLIKLPHAAIRSRVQAVVASFTCTAAFFYTIAVSLHRLLRCAAQTDAAKPNHVRGMVFKITSMQCQTSCLTRTTGRLSTDMREKCNGEQFCMLWWETSIYRYGHPRMLPNADQCGRLQDCIGNTATFFQSAISRRGKDLWPIFKACSFALLVFDSYSTISLFAHPYFKNKPCIFPLLWKFLYYSL